MNEIVLLPSPQQLEKLSKKDLQKLARTTAQGVSNHGVLNELEVMVRARKLADFYTELAKGIQGRAEEEARKEQPKGAFEKFGAKITHISGPSKWKYDNCGDPVYAQLLEERKALDARIKEREAFLQNVPESGMDWVDGEGEVHSIRRAVKVAGAEGISITY